MQTRKTKSPRDTSALTHKSASMLLAKKQESRNIIGAEARQQIYRNMSFYTALSLTK